MRSGLEIWDIKADCGIGIVKSVKSRGLGSGKEVLDTGHLQDSIEFYAKHGFKQADVPYHRVKEMVSGRFQALHVPELTHITNGLLDTESPTSEGLARMVDCVLAFLERCVPCPQYLRVQDGEEGRKNITYLSEVIGFCGIQEQEGVRYVYGTGCTEPQLTTLIKEKS